MKTIYLILICLIVNYGSNAQTNTYPPSGNVGIGTLSPASNLQIGKQTGVSTTTPVTLSLGGTYNNVAGLNPKLKLYDDGSTLYGFGISNAQLDGIVPSGANFAWYVGGSQKMILNNAGNVGIGTTAPTANLSFQNVDSDFGNSGITWYNPTPLLYGIYKTPGAWNAPNYQQLEAQWSTGILLNPGNSYGKSYVEVIGGGLRVTSGNVGIGTTNTQGYMLAVAGSAIATSGF